MRMITAIAAKSLAKFLAKDFRQIFGSAQEDRAERLSSLARSTMEFLGRTDALYHNLEHTMLVTLVGRDILRGRTLTERIEATDYDHLIVACLLHDIGYVRGALKGDTKTDFVIDESGRTVTLPRGASDAALTPYHVTRSKIFAYERFGKSPTLDANRLARAIEATRFPPGSDHGADLEPTLVQAADLIGQLGDPLYARKANALYYEFEEIGMNRQLGYTSPADLIDKYPAFYWNSVAGHLGAATMYLSATVSGQQWIAHLHNHVFCAEHSCRLIGPQS
jgi:hypothetical protein